jgi:hypothetical protein
VSEGLLCQIIFLFRAILVHVDLCS